MKKAGIIGGSGFIGSYITKKFLEENYKVKVSSTDISNKEKYKHLSELNNADNLEIVSLNTEDINSLKEFVSDCEILIHCGTPFKLEFQDPKTELFDPTIKGTENLLKLLSESTLLKKVVFVASVAAFNTAFPMGADGRNADHIYTEEDTPFILETNHPYAQAKHYADQTVRKFVKENPDLKIEIVSVFPTFVCGKSMSGRQDSTSTGIQFLFKNKIAPNDFVQSLFDQNVEFAIVDVCDVAEGIFKAATINGLHGKNYLLSNESYKISDMTLMLNKQQPEGTANFVYSGKLAANDLGIKFKAAQVSLNEYE